MSGQLARSGSLAAAPFAGTSDFVLPRRRTSGPLCLARAGAGARGIVGWAAAVKRLEDILFALAALALFAIPMLGVALAVRLDSPGPILFRQRRIGLNDQPFEMLKFRTMRHDMADPEVARQVTRGDPRVTRLGAFLRRTSLDELPQLFHVLRGEMALVGPRPHAPGTRAGGRLFHEVVPSYSTRHRIRPGLTGLAQVRGFRGEMNRAGFPGGDLVWVRRPRLAPRLEHSSALPPRREVRGRWVRVGGGC